MRLTEHHYGKTGVRLAKLERHDGGTDFHDLTVKLWLEGDFSAAYLTGDNSTTLPTDTMRATTYAYAGDGSLAEAEVFLAGVLGRLLEATPAAASAHAEAMVHTWERTGGDHPHGFHRGAGDTSCLVVVHRDGPTVVTSGIEGLDVVKTAGSEYAGFLTDEFTVLPPTTDRILATSVDATWTWASVPTSYAAARTTALRVAEETLVDHHSLAVQQTLVAVAEALLAAVPEMGEVTLRMPNRHHVPVDLTPFGRPNRNEVFVVQDRPYGEIVGTVARS